LACIRSSCSLRLEYAQYREMLRLTKLRTRLSDEAMAKLRRGEALHELLMQANGDPLPVEKEIVQFYAFQRKILEAISPPALKRFLDGFYEYLLENGPQVVGKIREKMELTSEIKSELDARYREFFNKIKEEEEHKI